MNELIQFPDAADPIAYKIHAALAAFVVPNNRIRAYPDGKAQSLCC